MKYLNDMNNKSNNLCSFAGLFLQEKKVKIAFGNKNSELTTKAERGRCDKMNGLQLEEIIRFSLWKNENNENISFICICGY